MDMTDPTKAVLRRRAGQLLPATAAESRAVTQRLAGLTSLDDAAVACLYLPMPHELDITGIVDSHQDVDWLITRTPPVGSLTMHAIDAPREVHRYGFEQPVADAEAVPPDHVDVFLVPGLAFDRDGNRLGHGAGYYDRLLAGARDDAVLVGVTLRRRLVASVAVEAHDVAMTLVVTEHDSHGVRPTAPADD